MKPHARPFDVVPDEEERPESLAMALLGLAAVVGFAVALYLLLWALG